MALPPKQTILLLQRLFHRRSTQDGPITTPCNGSVERERNLELELSLTSSVYLYA